MMIMDVHLLKQLSSKIWKYDLLKVFNSWIRMMLIITVRLQGKIFARHFLSNFY